MSELSDYEHNDIGGELAADDLRRLNSARTKSVVSLALGVGVFFLPILAIAALLVANSARRTHR